VHRVEHLHAALLQPVAEGLDAVGPLQGDEVAGQCDAAQACLRLHLRQGRPQRGDVDARADAEVRLRKAAEEFKGASARPARQVQFLGHGGIVHQRWRGALQWRRHLYPKHLNHHRPTRRSAAC